MRACVHACVGVHVCMCVRVFKYYTYIVCIRVYNNYVFIDVCVCVCAFVCVSIASSVKVC